MKQLIERDITTGVELFSEIRKEPGGGVATIYSVWQVGPSGKRVGISGFNHADLNEAKAAYSNQVQSQKAHNQ